jgi:hypothetical protein
MEDLRQCLENCGNDYDKAFQVRLNGKDHTFDSFECAIKRLHRFAQLAVRALLAMEWKRTTLSIAALIALKRKARHGSETVNKRLH